MTVARDARDTGMARERCSRDRDVRWSDASPERSAHVMRAGALIQRRGPRNQHAAQGNCRHALADERTLTYASPEVNKRPVKGEMTPRPVRVDTTSRAACRSNGRPVLAPIDATCFGAVSGGSRVAPMTHACRRDAGMFAWRRARTRAGPSSRRRPAFTVQRNGSATEERACGQGACAPQPGSSDPQARSTTRRSHIGRNDPATSSTDRARLRDLPRARHGRRCRRRARRVRHARTHPRVSLAPHRGLRFRSAGERAGESAACRHVGLSTY